MKKSAVSPVSGIEDRLRRSPNIPSLLQTMLDALSSGTLGKHMPRYYVPSQQLCTASGNLVNTLSLEGIKDGKALFEIRPHPDAVQAALGETAHFDFTRYRRDIQAPFIDKPWLRALVPLRGGSVEGAVVQLRQPTTFRSNIVGFIGSQMVGRRGSFSRHVEAHDVGNGANNSYLPVTSVARNTRESAYIAVPIDSYVTLRIQQFERGLLPIATAGVLYPTASLSAHRVTRREMRDSAMDNLSKVSAALAVLDLSGSDHVLCAITLQDLLGLDKFVPDYHFGLELEVASGRHTSPSYAFESEFSAAVLAGALHAGARSQFHSENDARTFIQAVKSFGSILRAKQDKVFQANTLFSSYPTPSDVKEFSALHTLANGDIKSI